ncbi:ABC transporter substrate-binding protein, partial [Rhodovulum sulfidophilum]|nr:ABC transporter substrate-binding protein [Rhodovulum sulfidophilum]
MRRFVPLAVTLGLLAGPAVASDPADWPALLSQAQGQTVYWNAWGGAAATNDFIRW